MPEPTLTIVDGTVYVSDDNGDPGIGDRIAWLDAEEWEDLNA